LKFDILHKLDALKVLDKIVELDPPTTLTIKAQKLYKLGLYEGALKEMDKTIDLAPNRPYFRYIKSDMLRKLGRYEETQKEHNMAEGLEYLNYLKRQ